MDVSVIIVNYNTCKVLNDCLASVFQYTSNIEYEVIVVDNASNDESVEMVKNKYPSVKIIESQKNLGLEKQIILVSNILPAEIFFYLTQILCF